MGKSRTQVVASLAILLAWCACAFALDPSLDISQYAHTSWKVRDGFTKGAIWSIAQTPDGYLWLGTELGLYRFDGVRAVPWQPPNGQQLPSNFIVSLLAAHDGTLWIGTSKGVASWKDGKLTNHPEPAGLWTDSLLEDREGSIWIGARGLRTGKLCRVTNDTMNCFGEDGSLGSPTDLYEDSKGSLWVGVVNGLWRWRPGVSQFYAMPDEPDGIRALSEDDDGTLLFGTQRGLRRFANGRPESYPVSVPQAHLAGILRDRDGGLWMGTSNRGIVHVYRRKTSSLAESEGLASDNVLHIFEDREGNVWVAGEGGIDRFRSYAVTTITTKQGLSSNSAWSVLADQQNVWTGTLNGLNQIINGQITRFGSDGKLNGEAADFLFKDSRRTFWVSTFHYFGFLKTDHFFPIRDWPGGYVHSVIEDHPGSLWVANQDLGLFHLSDGTVVQHIPWARLGRNDYAHNIVADPLRGGLWIGFREGKLAYLADGTIRATYTASNGLGAGVLNSLNLDRDGTLWVATEGGLSRLKNGSISTMAAKNGLPCDAVDWALEDDDHTAWLYTPCGLVRIAHSELEAWITNPKRTIQTTVFDSSDGVRSSALAGNFGPRVTKSADGKLWFLPLDGVSFIDPHHLPFNKVPPPVHIEKITADDKNIDISNGMHLPKGVRHLDIDYTALSLVVPEKVRFRVKLEGEDKDWRELVNVRHVEYTNLPPKHYKFRVLACNNSGVWNEQGAALDIVIPPAWYQTNWFYALCAAAFLASLWAAYQLRVRQLAHQFNMRLEERVAERTRVARDLHDTLLQSFQALLPLLQASINMFGSRPADALRTFEKATDHASQAIAEGRDAIQGMRMSTVEKNDLAVAIRTVGEELASGASGQPSPNFNVVVEGVSRKLHPILRDEIYRLAVEALRNAFRHAAAQSVEVEIRYDEKYFRLRVRDDGKGIPSDVLSGDGREGHYGLPGMRERAKLVGGKLAIWTELDGGTEIELNIPGARAYVKSTRPFWQFGKRSATETDEKEQIERE